VRMGGGRDMVLSFKLVETMKEKLLTMKDWLNDGYKSVLEWRQGISKNWEVVIAMDDDTLLKSSSEEIADNQITDKSNRHKEKDDDVEVQIGKKSDLRRNVAGVGNDVSPVIADQLDTDDRYRVDDEVYTPGFIKSLSGSEGNRLGIQIEVDLNRTQMTGGLVGGIGRPKKMKKIKKSLADRKVDIVLLQETKKATVLSHYGISRNNRNSLCSVVVNGSMINEPLEIKDAIKAHFMRQFLEDWKVRPKLSSPFKRAEVGSNGLRVTYLQFVNDTILFCDADRMKVSNIKKILRCFEISSEGLLQEFASSLNCLYQKLPLKYLGLPLGANPSRRSTWKPVLDKFKQKLSTWKRRLLSFAGRLTLIKSVMSNLPLYYLSLLRIPAGVAKEIKRMKSTFFWVSLDLRRKVHMIRESLLGPAVPVADSIWNNFSPPKVQFFSVCVVGICFLLGNLLCFGEFARLRILCRTPINLRHSNQLWWWWWKKREIATKLPFARDRLVECYFWILGVYFEPKYSVVRSFMTKIIALASVIDDIYDVYGTLEELQLFTDAIERWEEAAISDLPEYMQVCFEALSEVMKEMEDKITTHEGRSYHIYYAKGMKGLVRAYFVEANWFNTKYVPTFEEYLSISVMSSGYPMLAVQSLVGIGKIATKEAFDWVLNVPKIVESCALIARLVDDIQTHKQERGDAPSGVQCYMREHGVSEEEACGKIREIVDIAWKDINEELQNPNRLLPLPLLLPALNLSRMMEVIYGHGDGYTNSKGRTKDIIIPVLVNPISM
ncbi:(-)-germacrene D synthase, partial [Camellia lanceoleosa]